MSAAPLRDNEDAALAALEALGVMDTEHEPAFDALVRAASLVCGVPMSLISLIDADRQWFKANVGLTGVTETPRDVAFCAHAVLGNELFEVTDATKDARFSNNPLVLGDPSIRFYAGMPLRLSDGNRVGTLCIIDRTPRQLTQAQREILVSLGEAAARLLEGSRALKVVKAAEASLELERKRLANIIDANEVGTWEWNLKTGEARFSERWARMIGYALSELEPQSTQTWLSTIHPEDRARASAAQQRHLKGLSKRIDCEVRVKHKAGHWVWVNDRGRVMTYDDSGEPEWVVGARLDISLRKQREEAQRRNEDFLDRTGRLAGIGGWEVDLSTNRLFFTAETERIHGIAPGRQLTLEESFDFYAPEAKPRVVAAVEHSVKTGEGWDMELPFIRANGQRIWVRTVGSAEYSNGKPTRLIGAFQDITAQVGEHMALKAANDRIAVATDSGGIGVWEFDLATRTSKWDPWVFKLYGLPVDTAPVVDEKVWGELTLPDSLRAIRKAVAKAVAGEADFDIEFGIRWPDDSIHFLRSSARLIRDAEGKPTGLIGANWDITEQRRVAAVLRQQTVVASVQAGVAVAANESQTLAQALQTCVDLICQHTGWSVGHVYVPSADHADRWTSSGVWSRGAKDDFPSFYQETTRTTFANGVGMVGSVVRERKPMQFNAMREPQFLRRAPAAAAGLQWGLAAPVLVGEQVVAVLEFFSTQGESFDSALLDLVSYAGLQIGRVVDRERASAALKAQTMTLRQQSIVDELTGLYNRRGFLELAQERMTAASRTSQRAFLVFADLDGMKRINDELGHEAGDAALVLAASVLRRTLRSVDVVARLGGDEFVALTCETGVFDPDALVRRLEAEVVKVNAESTQPFQVAISFGVSGPAGEKEPIQDLLKRADEAMYLKKQARKAAKAASSSKASNG